MSAHGIRELHKINLLARTNSSKLDFYKYCFLEINVL